MIFIDFVRNCCIFFCFPRVLCWPPNVIQSVVVAMVVRVDVVGTVTSEAEADAVAWSVSVAIAVAVVGVRVAIADCPVVVVVMMLGLNQQACNDCKDANDEYLFESNHVVCLFVCLFESSGVFGFGRKFACYSLVEFKWLELIANDDLLYSTAGEADAVLSKCIQDTCWRDHCRASG